MPRPTDRYPDYEELTGFTLTDDQLADIIRLKSLRARRGELTHRAYVRELIEFLGHAPGTFRFEAPEADKPTARFGRQVQHTPGHALYQPDESWLAERAETLSEIQHAETLSEFDAETEGSTQGLTRSQTTHLVAYDEALESSDAALDALIDDVLDISRDLAYGQLDREGALAAWFERLEADPTVWAARKAGHDGRVHLDRALINSHGLGLFRPEPAEMDADPAFSPQKRQRADEHTLEADADDPGIETVALDPDAGVLEVAATLPEGGHIVIVTPQGRPLVATAYLEAGETTAPFDVAPLAEADAETLLVMLFKGSPGEEFDLENDPYTLFGALIREEIALDEQAGDGMEVSVVQ